MVHVHVKVVLSNCEQVSLIRPIYIEHCILVLRQVVLIARVVLIPSGLNNETSLYLPQFSIFYRKKSVGINDSNAYCMKTKTYYRSGEFCNVSKL